MNEQIRNQYFPSKVESLRAITMFFSDINIIKKFLLLTLLSLSFSSFAEIRCGGNLWTLQEVITPIDSYQVIITKYACTRYGEYIDGQLYENGKPVTPLKGTEGY